MRWDPLFDDLASQADAAAEADADAEVAESARHAWGQRTVIERLRATVRTPVRCRGTGGLDVTGSVHQVGTDWVLIRCGTTQWTLVALTAITVLDGLGATADIRAVSQVDAAHTTRAVLRQLCRARQPVEIVTSDGLRLVGTVARVGADHVDLARHPMEEAPRPRAIQGVSVIALAGLAWLSWHDSALG